MATALDTKQFIAAVTRLTGEPKRRTRHGLLFRLVVTSCDKKTCAIPIGPISDHRDQPSKATANMVADRLRVPRRSLDEVLQGWSKEDLEKHLAAKKADELKPPARGH